MNRLRVGIPLLLLFLIACAPTTTLAPTTPTTVTPITPPTPTPTATSTPTPKPTSTPTKTLTPKPWGDPDADGYSTYFEDVWGTDPFTDTSFEDLAMLSGIVYAKMRVSQPFEFADMNETFYQVARLIDIDDNGTPDYPGDDHLTFEVVLFPYAKDRTKPMEVDQFPIEPGVYPPEVQKSLISYEDDISNITPELKETMLAIVNGTGEAYSTPARTDVQAIERIMRWNSTNLEVNPMFETYYPLYGTIVRMRAGDMFEERLTRWSTTRAVILNAELRAIGIPSKVYMHVDCECYPYKENNCGRGGGNHPQNGAFVGNHWVIFDYNGVNPRGTPYEYLVITDGYRDNNEAIFDKWIQVVDTPRVLYPFDELIHTLERRDN